MKTVQNNYEPIQRMCVMNDKQIIITYGIARNTSKEYPKITYCVYIISEENTEKLDWLHTVLYSDPIIPCEIEARAEQALTRHLRKNPKYQHRNIIFRRNNQGRNAISGIEDIGFEWHTTRKNSWEEKTQELEKFLLYAQYNIKHPQNRICSDLEIIPDPLTSVKPVLVQFKGKPGGADLISRQKMMDILHASDTSLDTWHNNHILVARAGIKPNKFYFVSHINKSFEKLFYSKKKEYKDWYARRYYKLKYFSDIRAKSTV